MKEEVWMLLEGMIAELIVKLIAEQKRQTNVISKTQEGPYGALQATLLFWRQLSNTLVEWGFKFNE